MPTERSDRSSKIDTKPGQQAMSGGGPTRTALLAAAELCLRENGYAALSTRQVALVAKIPLSQIHYHFGSKQGLVLALFETLNERLLQRQTEMFQDDMPLSRQWKLACDFLDDDLNSGYVRTLNELAVAGWSDEQVAAAVRNAMNGWQKLLLSVAQRILKQYGGFGPLKAEDVAALVGSAFLGAEVNILSGHDRKDYPVRRALRRFGEFIRQIEENGKSGG